MKLRPALVAAVAFVLVVGCSSSQRTVPGTVSSASAVPGSSSPASSSSPSPDSGDQPAKRSSSASATASKTTSTENLLLPNQVRVVQRGNGIGSNCPLDENTPDDFRQDPGIWLHVYSGQPERYPGVVVLCLRGFRADTPILVQAVVGNRTAETRVIPRAEAPMSVTRHGYDENPPETLFNGQELFTYPNDPDQYTEQPPDSLVTEMWHFLPPPDVRAALAATGSLRLTARQGALNATISQPIPIPQASEYTAIERNGSAQLILYGYPAGAAVPVGLYRQSDSTTSAKLIRQVATVKMPDARVGDFRIETQTLLAGQPTGRYCLLPPIREETDCFGPTKWPAYPGLIEEGQRGKRVKVWQEILIQADVISDTPENRDGYYGPATVATVQQYLSNRSPQSGNPDGGTTLGRGVYELLTGF